MGFTGKRAHMRQSSEWPIGLVLVKPMD